MSITRVTGFRQHCTDLVLCRSHERTGFMLLSESSRNSWLQQEPAVRWARHAVAMLLALRPRPLARALRCSALLCSGFTRSPVVLVTMGFQWLSTRVGVPTLSLNNTEQTIKTTAPPTAFPKSKFFCVEYLMVRSR